MHSDEVATGTTARFFGGPLDGRDAPLPDADVAAGRQVTHVFLHAGPKIETHYRLGRTSEGRWEYRVVDPG
ncbi:MAG: hypothetical protein ACRDRN_19380 [Sciscionella sp.]